MFQEVFSPSVAEPVPSSLRNPQAGAGEIFFCSEFASLGQVGVNHSEKLETSLFHLVAGGLPTVLSKLSQVVFDTWLIFNQLEQNEL